MLSEVGTKIQPKPNRVPAGHKYLGLLLYMRLSFNKHIQKKKKKNKCYKMIGGIKRLSVNLPRDALLRI